MSRVKKKTFILTTILAPIGFVIFFIALIFIMSSGVEKKQMAILDESNILEGQKPADNMVYFTLVKTPLEELKTSFEEKGFNGFLHIPAGAKQDSSNTVKLKTLNIEYYSNEQLGVNTLGFIEKSLAARLKQLKIKKVGLDPNVLKSLETDIELIPKNLDPESKDEASKYRVYVATFLGGAMMFLIYLVIFIYGNMVMRSVMEEKTNRIVEVIISSVKPFQLMLGKIVGVGAVGLTQFAIWAIVFPLLYLGVGLLFSGQLQEMQEIATASGGAQASSEQVESIAMAMQEIWSFDYTNIVLFFIFFFLSGYVLYASLFAAVGAAMGDDWGEGQSLTLIIAIPVMIAFYMGVATIENPNSSLALFSSMFPLFSPVVMPARIVFDPPLWQILLSLGLLIATCLFFIWISGRIYRVGILMYGKKITVKEMAKWIFRRD
ncbi:MAG: ABC transporter permease [Saprospiraceae bacterium]|nr:ABC transporter permease [Saprospiraceae bacterium]